jgi:hypothetical protein
MHLLDWLTHPQGPDDDHRGQRKTQRAMSRELLYTVVRECMANAGVVSASYKFKVLSLDSRGRKAMVMVDVARDFASDAMRTAEIEAAITRTARVRHGLEIFAVYWRGPRLARHHHASAHPEHSAPDAREDRTIPVPLMKTPERAHGPRNEMLITGYEETLAPARAVFPQLGETQPGELPR